MGAVLLKTYSDGYGLGLAIPAEDLTGPDGGIAQAHYVSPEQHDRVLAGEPLERIVPAYRFSHISVFIEAQHAWITNGSGERIDVPLEGTDEVPPELRRCFGAAIADLVGHSNGFGWDIPKHDFLGPDGGRATFMKTPDGQMYGFQYVKPLFH
jgi:hypothetical protein